MRRRRRVWTWSIASWEKIRSAWVRSMPRAVAVGRDVGGEAAQQLGMLVDGLVVDEQAVEGAAADRVVQDRGDLAMRRGRRRRRSGRPPRRRGSARGAGPPAGSRPSACPRPSVDPAGGRGLPRRLLGDRSEPRAASRSSGPRASPSTPGGLLAQGLEGPLQGGQVPGRRHARAPLQHGRRLLEPDGQGLAVARHSARATRRRTWGSGPRPAWRRSASRPVGLLEPDGRPELGRALRSGPC